MLRRGLLSTVSLPARQPGIQLMIRYLGACFAWEYANQGDVSFTGSRTRFTVELQVETMASGLSAWPLCDADSGLEISRLYKRHARGSTLVYGLFPVRLQDAEESISPLLIAELNDTLLQATALSGTPLPSGVSPALFVNRALLTKICTSEAIDESVVEPLANDLQDIIDLGPIDKQRMEELLKRISHTLPLVELVGFDTWPLLLPLPSHSRTSTTSAIAIPLPEKSSASCALHCSAAVMIVRRSRQSTSVLHELESLARLKTAASMSAPLKQLIDHQLSRMKQQGRQGKASARGHYLAGALSAAQRYALRAASTQTLSVVIGPPGTGKTHTLSAIAAESVASGNSVLICARSQAAVNVAERFLTERLALDGVIMRGGDITSQRRLKATLNQILQSGQIAFSREFYTDNSDQADSKNVKSLEREYRYSLRNTRQLERKLRSLDRTIRRLTNIANGNASLVMRMEHRLRCMIGDEDAALALATASAQRYGYLDKLTHSSLVSLQARLRRNVRQQLEQDRPALARLADSFTAREHRQLKLQASNDYRALLTPFPVWIGTLADLGRMLPMQRELFDLVLIDEASQIDPASALPALQRAKRAVVFGDPAQLRHVSFLPLATEADLLRRKVTTPHDPPSFRQDSLLDWVSRLIAEPAAINVLDEHFRSAPPIIGFSNREFYSNRLTLLTRLTHASAAPVISIVQVDTGRRDAQGINRKEADVLIERCLSIVNASASKSDHDAPGIGIISPFRAQANHLERVLKRKLGHDLFARHRLVVGTAHELQGEERDIVLFSTAVDNDSPGGAVAFLSRPDVLNVAITRGKHQHIVFLSRDPRTL